MPIPERLISMIAQWAKDAQTNIPTPPVPGVAYRNAALSPANFAQGQAYDKVYDSARYNQRDFIITGLLQFVEQFGGLPWSSLTNYPEGGFVLGSNNKLYQALRTSGPAVAGVGAKNPTVAANTAYWLDYAASITPPPADPYELCTTVYSRLCAVSKPGFVPVNGTLVANAVNKYPVAWAYLQTAEGKQMCVTEAAWQALTRVTWHANADGAKVGWDGVGGAPKYVIDLNAGTIRVPDLRGMTDEVQGFDSLGVGGVRPDMQRRITGKMTADRGFLYSGVSAAGAFKLSAALSSFSGQENTGYLIEFDSGLDTPVGPRNHGPRYISDARVYLGQPAL